MTPPSKELLSAVLARKIIKVKSIMNSTLYFNNVEHGEYIKIHNLAQKIKVWALEQGYLISEIGKYVLIIKIDTGVTKHRIDNDFYEVGDVDWSDLFDVSSVFKAGEWVLNQQDKGI